MLIRIAGEVMSAQKLFRYARRLKIDGLDSICPYCFITVGSAKTEEDLELFERDHVCDPVLLERVSRVLHRESTGQRSRSWGLYLKRA